MIGIIDYGVGNIGSIRNGLEFLKIPYVISHKTKDLSSCQGIILPGVGAFESAIKKLKSYDLVDFIKDYSKKIKNFWEYVWVCNFCLKKVMKVVNIKDFV